MLKPQDIVIAAKLLTQEKENWSQGGLAQQLVMSASEVNAGIKRLSHTGLIEKQEDNRRWKVVKRNFQEFLIHGIKYVFPAEKGAPCTGLPTSIAAEPLKSHLSSTGICPVWPDKKGKVKGFAFQPLYTTVPQAIHNDNELYQWLAIIDALRDNEMDEREVAIVALQDALSGRKAVETKPDNQSAIDDNQLDLLSLS